MSSQRNILRCVIHAATLSFVLAGTASADPLFDGAGCPADQTWLVMAGEHASVMFGAARALFNSATDPIELAVQNVGCDFVFTIPIPEGWTVSEATVGTTAWWVTTGTGRIALGEQIFVEGVPVWSREPEFLSGMNALDQTWSSFPLPVEITSRFCQPDANRELTVDGSLLVSGEIDVEQPEVQSEYDVMLGAIDVTAFAYVACQ